MILMVADALELNAFAVKKASFVRIKTNGTHAKMAMININGFTFDLDMGF